MSDENGRPFWPAIAAIGTALAGVAAVISLFFDSEDRVVLVSYPPPTPPTVTAGKSKEHSPQAIESLASPEPVLASKTEDAVSSGKPLDASDKPASALTGEKEPNAQTGLVPTAVVGPPLAAEVRDTSSVSAPSLQPEPAEPPVEVVAALPDADGCIRVGAHLGAPVQVRPGTRICAALSQDQVVVQKITENAVYFSLNGGFATSCDTTELCGFDWPRGPIFNVRVITDPNGARAGRLSAPKR